MQININDIEIKFKPVSLNIVIESQVELEALLKLFSLPKNMPHTEEGHKIFHDEKVLYQQLYEELYRKQLPF